MNKKKVLNLFKNKDTSIPGELNQILIFKTMFHPFKRSSVTT